jgi:hypothetical protein
MWFDAHVEKVRKVTDVFAPASHALLACKQSAGNRLLEEPLR